MPRLQKDAFDSEALRGVFHRHYVKWGLGGDSPQRRFGSFAAVCKGAAGSREAPQGGALALRLPQVAGGGGVSPGAIEKIGAPGGRK